MSQGQRHLMFLQKDGSGIVVEAMDSSGWENLKQEAESKGNDLPNHGSSIFHPIWAVRPTRHGFISILPGHSCFGAYRRLQSW